MFKLSQVTAIKGNMQNSKSKMVMPVVEKSVTPEDPSFPKEAQKKVVFIPKPIMHHGSQQLRSLVNGTYYTGQNHAEIIGNVILGERATGNLWLDVEL